MGLAPYGDPERFRAFFDGAVQLTDDGGWRIPPLKLASTRDERESHMAHAAPPGRAPDRRARAGHPRSAPSTGMSRRRCRRAWIARSCTCARTSASSGTAPARAWPAAWRSTRRPTASCSPRARSRRSTSSRPQPTTARLSAPPCIERRSRARSPTIARPPRSMGRRIRMRGDERAVGELDGDVEVTRLGSLDETAAPRPRS